MKLNAKISIAGLPLNNAGGGATSWDDLTGKPFSSVDTENGLTIQDDTLMIDTLDHIATIDYVDQQIADIDLSDYATKSELDAVEEEIPSLTGYATEQYVDNAIADIDMSDYPTYRDLENYATKTEIPQADNVTIVDNNGIWSAVSGGSVEIDNKSLIKNSDDEIQMAVPLYTETIEHSLDGLKFTQFNYPAGNDLDCYLPVNSNTITLSQYYDVYLITTSEEVWSGRWDSTNIGSYSYGGWGSINFTNGTLAIDSELYWALEGNYRIHVYMGGDVILGESGGSTGNISSLIFIPVDTADTLHSQLSSLGLDSYWGTFSQFETVVHKLPEQYYNSVKEPSSWTGGTVRNGKSVILTGTDGISMTMSQITDNTGATFPYYEFKSAFNNGSSFIPGGSNIISFNLVSVDTVNHTKTYESDAWYGDSENQKFSITLNFKPNYTTNTIKRYGRLVHEVGQIPVITGLEDCLVSVVDGNNGNFVYTIKLPFEVPAGLEDAWEVELSYYFAPAAGEGAYNFVPISTIDPCFLPIDNNTIKVNSDGNIYADVQGGGSQVSVTQTLSSGTAIADVTIDGVTTTLYAPAGSGSTQADWAETDSTADSYIQNKPAVYAGTHATNPGVILGSGTASGSRAVATGSGCKASGMSSFVTGMNNEDSGSPAAVVEGIGNNNVSNYGHAQGKYKTKWPWRNAAFLESDVADSIGNGTSNSNRSCAEVTTWTGDKFLAGDIYTNVTDWSDPRSNSIKLANIPACPTTTAGTFSLQATVDSDGNVTYSWV